MKEAFPLLTFSEIDLESANLWLREWGHYLGAANRPFGQQAFALRSIREERPLVVAVSASTISATVAGYARKEAVELARLVRRPDAGWATRVGLRLWREIGAREWPYWPVRVAVAYHKNGLHEGHIYRTDGWEKCSETAGSGGGGTYTRPRAAGTLEQLRFVGEKLAAAEVALAQAFEMLDLTPAAELGREARESVRARCLRIRYLVEEVRKMAAEAGA